MRKIKFLFIILALLPTVAGHSAPSGTADPAVAPVKELATRILPGQSRNIEFRIVKDSDTDFYTLETADGHLLISGNNPNSLATGLGDYLRDWCHINVTWFSGERITEPSKLPALPGKIRRDAIVRNRFFLNYCTFGYTLNFWNWEQWERLIDWMALNGVTMALANTGQEAVWQKVWTDLGLTDMQVRSYFTGPSYLAWHRMTNLDGWHSPLPQGWIDGQKELQKKIIGREISLGISPILSMFTGHVPAALREVFPKADIRKLSAWGDFEEKYNPWYLSPEDPLFKEIQKAYLTAQKETYGQDSHIYGVDLFNEVDPPHWDKDYLSKVSAFTYETMQEMDPEAVWLQMSWMFWYKKKNWTPELIEAYLSPVPKHRLLMLDYYCDKVELWRTTDAFYGQDYIWSYLGNFGGNTMISGNFNDVSGKLDRVVSEGGPGFVGVGCTLEGLDVNPMMYGYVLDRAWSRTEGDDAWIRKEADSRCGSEDPEYREAWKILAEKVYLDYSGNKTSMVGARPTLTGRTRWSSSRLGYDNAALIEAWGHLAASANSSSPAWRFDCVNIPRQCLANIFGEQYDAYCKAYRASDLNSMKNTGTKMLGILDDLEKLTAADNYFLLGKWISDSRSWATSREEKSYYEWDAKAIVSCWGFLGGKLNDYANREWNGLIGTYYKPRWQKFIEETCKAVETGDTFDEEAFKTWSCRFEWDWVGSSAKFRKEPSGNPGQLCRSLYDKYVVKRD